MRTSRPITHTNRCGQTYFLRVGRKNGGGVQYYFSRNRDGSLAESIPKGFEIYESVRGQVFLRREQPKLIQDSEKALIKQEIEKKDSANLYKIEVSGKTLTIFECSSEIEKVLSFSPMFSVATLAEKRELRERFANYQAVLRFILSDSGHRIFTPERYCFRGSVDDWITIGPSESLEKIAAKYLQHLGLDSLYDFF